ncbi:MAG: hypothetical protein V3T70_03205, partial [Phycisphaerae bacterium]
MMWNVTVAGLGVAALAGAALHRRLRPGLGISLFIIASSFAIVLLCFRFEWPLRGDVHLLLRLTAALSAVWAACGWATRHDDPRDPANPRDASQQPTGSACFFAGSFHIGVLAVILIVILCLAALLGRILMPNLAALIDANLPDRLPVHGRNDIVALALALWFWRMARSDSLQPLVALVLGSALAAWTSLMIPGAILGASAVDITTVGFAPGQWWTWIVNLQFG